MEKSKMADGKEAAAGRSPASNRTTVKQMDPTLTASASASSSNNSKPKKKRESKEVRLARREAKALKEIYAPKDSRVSLITPAIMKLFNNSSRGNRSNSTYTSFPSTNQVPSGNEKLMTGVEFPTISQSSITAPKIFKPPPQSTLVSIEPQGNDETTSRNVPATTAAAVRKSKKNDTPSKNPIVLNLEELIHAAPSTSSQNRKTKKRDRGAGQDGRKEAMMHKFSTNSNVLDSSGPILLHRGKIRLNRKKRSTALKKAILLSRALRKENQSKSLESEPALIGSSVVDPDLTNLPLQSLSISDADAVDNAAADSADNADADVETSDLKGTSKVGAETRETQEHSQRIQNAEKETEKSTSVKEIDSSSQKIVSCASEIVPDTPVPEHQETSSTEADYSLIFRKLLDEALLSSSNRSITDGDGTPLSAKTAQNEADAKQKMVESSSNNFQVVSGEVLEKAKDKMHKKCKKWRPYCDMYTCHELHGEVIALLLELHRFQDRLYHSDPIKFQNNKRYVHGLKEVSASLQRNKVQLLIIAPDVEPTPGVKGGLEDKMEEVLGVARSRGIPYLFSGHRFILGKPIRIKRPVSIIGILNKQGAEELVEKVMKHVARLRDRYTFDLNAFITQVEEEQQRSTQVKSI